MLKKRGTSEIQEQLFFVFELLLVLFVGFALFRYVNTIVENQLFEAEYLTRDTALLMNTMSGINSNVFFNFLSKKDLNLEFNTVLTNNVIITLNNKKFKQYGIDITFPFATNQNHIYNLKNPGKFKNTIHFIKQGNNFIVSEKTGGKTKSYYYENVKTSNIPKKINLKCASEIESFCNNLKQYSESRNLGIEFTTKDSDIYLTISKNTKNKVTIVKNKESRKFASLIFNNLNKDSIIIVDSSQLDALVIINLELTEELINHPSTLEAFKNTIEEFFK